MLSRVLHGDEATAAQPVPWRRVAGSGAPRPAIGSNSVPVAGTPMNAVVASGPPRRHVVTTDDEVAVLQARVAELEATMNKRVTEQRDAAYREGEQKARVQVEPLLEKLAKSIHELSDLRAKLRHEAEGDLLKLSLAIAKKVVHRELTADPEALAGLVRVALEKIRFQEILRVRVHPQYQATIQQLVTRLSGGAALTILADQRLPVGGVIVETTRGEFDSSVDVQLREIERGLTDRLAARA